MKSIFVNSAALMNWLPVLDSLGIQSKKYEVEFTESPDYKYSYLASRFCQVTVYKDDKELASVKVELNAKDDIAIYQNPRTGDILFITATPFLQEVIIDNYREKLPSGTFADVVRSNGKKIILEYWCGVVYEFYKD